jgi:NAD(P)-dependent dehydrogenase (short-subunit alcohol dehydrogenase family)
MAELRFDNRVAVITGAARGLGRSYALLLGSKGAKVVVNDPGGGVHGEKGDASPAEKVVQEIKAAGGEAVACIESLATPKGGAAIIKAATDRYGRIDILIHSAGITRTASVKEMTQEDFDAVVNVHQTGAFHVVRPAFPLMCKAGYGRIVLTSSICGVYGCYGNVNYGTAKTGLIGLSNILALEGAAEGVKSNIILPAAVTRMTGEWDTSAYPPMTTEQVAPAVAWLSHESCSISGEMIVAMAGRIAKAFVGETRGVYRPSWTVDDVAAQMDAIRNMDAPVVFPVLPEGHNEHIGYSFDMGHGPGWRSNWSKAGNRK